MSNKQLPVCMQGHMCINCGVGHLEGYKCVVPREKLDDGETDPFLLTQPCNFCGASFPAYVSKATHAALLEDMRVRLSEPKALHHIADAYDVVGMHTTAAALRKGEEP